jgi:hypothetical protein
MNIKELRDKIKDLTVEFTKDNQIGIDEIIVYHIYEMGNKIPLDYEIGIKVK